MGHLRARSRVCLYAQKKNGHLDRYDSLLWGLGLFVFLLSLIPDLSKGFFSCLPLGFFEEVVLLLITEHRFSLGRVHDEVNTINDEDKEERENNRQREEDGVILEGSDERSIEIEVLLVVRIRIDGDHDPNRND